MQILVLTAEDTPLVPGRTGLLSRGHGTRREAISQLRSNWLLLDKCVAQDGEQDGIVVKSAHLDSDLDHLAVRHRVPVRLPLVESIPKVLGSQLTVAVRQRRIKDEPESMNEVRLAGSVLADDHGPR